MGNKHENFGSLIKEIDKILSAPYAVLFTPLRHILNSINEAEILLWTIAKACQVAPLVGHIIESLEKDEAAWSILLSLITDRTVRDEVIKQNPVLLQKLFSNVNDNEVYNACMALCKYPFREEFAPPPEYTHFLSDILQNSRDEPHTIWSEKVYSLLISMAPGILQTLDNDVVQKCASIWNDTLKTSDNVPWVRVMSIAAFLHRNYPHDQSSPACSMASSPDSSALLNWTKKCSMLFSLEKSQKVIRSVILRALYFISGRSELPVADTSYCLEMIRQILDAFDPERLQLAMQEQDCSQIITKLSQKATPDSLPLTVRLLVFSMLAVIDPGLQHWDATALQHAFRQLLNEQLRTDKRRDSSAGLVLIDKLLFFYKYPHLLQKLARLCFSNSSLLHECVEHLIDWCRPGAVANINTVRSVHSAQYFMSLIDHVAAESGLSLDVARYFVATKLPDWWDWENGQPERIVHCRALDVCPQTWTILRQRLSKKISDTMIMLACTSGLQVAPRTYQMLERSSENQQRSVSDATIHCCIWPTCAIQQTYGTGRTVMSVLNRTQPATETDLVQALSNTNAQVTQIVNQYVDSICRDLQLRCQNIEEPLMRERARCGELAKQLMETRNSMDVVLADHQARTLSWQHDLDVAQQQYQNLEKQTADVELDLHHLHQQLDQETQKLRLTEDNNAQLRQQCQALHKELEDEKSRVSQSNEDLMNASSDNEKLRIQLEGLQSKEQRLLCVLRGGEVIS